MRDTYSLSSLLEVAEEESQRTGGAAVGAFNVNFFAQALGIIEGLQKAGAPGILQASKGAVKFQGGADNIVEMILEARKSFTNSKICIHLDHGNRENCLDCIEKGFDSVMADFSTIRVLRGLKYVESMRNLKENAKLTYEIVSLAALRNVDVEGEIGVLPGVEEDNKSERAVYPSPENVYLYVANSRVDAVAIACGTCHGPVKDYHGINFKLLRDSYELIKKGPTGKAGIVLHGSSTIPEELVDKINQYGGKIDKNKARGIPLKDLKEAIKCGARKVNIDTDLRLTITATLRKFFYENPEAHRESKALSFIYNVLFAQEAIQEEYKVVNPREIIDPRIYLAPLMQSWPEFLRKDYRYFDAPYFVSAMNLVKDAVAEHVEKLSREFGSSGLAKLVHMKKETLNNK